MSHDWSTADHGVSQVVIAGAYYPNYFLQGEMDEELASKELSGLNPRTTVMVFEFIVVKLL